MPTNWIQHRIQEAARTNATVLDLSLHELYLPRPEGSSDVLTTLPLDILELSNLRVLDLRGHRLTYLPTEIRRLERLESLNLRGSPLTDLGPLAGLVTLRDLDLSASSGFDGLLALEPLAALTGLRALRLHGAVFRPLPPEFRSLSALETLALPTPLLNSRALAELPSLTALEIDTTFDYREPTGVAADGSADPDLDWVLGRLTRLSVTGDLSPQALQNIGQAKLLRALRLRLSRPLDAIPATWANLVGLESLTLDFSRSVSFASDIEHLGIVAKLTSLRELELSDIVSPDIAGIVAELTALTDITLINCGLEAFPESVLHREGLRRLELGGNDITDVPPSIGRLTLLNSLDLEGNPLREISPVVGELSRLGHLNLRNLGLKRVPDWIGRLTNLTRLQLDGNRMVGLPRALAALPRLRVLGLSSTGIRTLPDWLGELAELEELDVPSNHIAELPPSLLTLEKLKHLNVSGNPLTNPPDEIAARGLVAIQGYLSAISQEGAARLLEAKLLIVGEGGVGKTCLAHKIVDPAFDIARHRESIESTHGIRIASWTFRPRQAGEFVVHVWDFGGQEIYYATHQFFLTRRSLYLLVWDARKEDRLQGFQYWLNVISTLSARSPVIVVMNKSDERTRDLDEQALERQFPNIVGFERVSALTGTGIPALVAAAQHHLERLPHVGDSWPQAWSRVRSQLEQNSADFLDLSEFLVICRDMGIEREEALQLSRYLHDLGVILHFQDDPLLRDTVILKPDWGTAAVYAIFDTRRVQERQGCFAFADLRTIWGGLSYSESKYLQLIQLMIKFELCFPLEGEHAYIVPELLSPRPPEIPEFGDEPTLRMDFEYRFMPAGIIGRFIARNHALAMDATYWKNGVMLQWDGAQALVVAEPLERRIRATVVGASRHEALGAIRYDLHRINSALNEVLVREVFPCDCHVCKLGDPYLFELEMLRRLRQRGLEKILCHKSLIEVSVEQLLTGILPRDAVCECDCPACREYNPHLFDVGSLRRIQNRGIDRALCPKSFEEVSISQLLAKFDPVDDPEPASLPNQGRNRPPYRGPVLVPREESPMSVQRGRHPEPSNPWKSGSFYLVAFVVVAIVLAAVGANGSPWVPVLVLIGGVVGIGAIGALQLRQDDRLSEKNFLELMGMTYRKLPVVRKLTESKEAERRPEPD